MGVIPGSPGWRAAASPVAAQPLFQGGTFDAGYNANRSAARFATPSGTRRAVIAATITGARRLPCLWRARWRVGAAGVFQFLAACTTGGMRCSPAALCGTYCVRPAGLQTCSERSYCRQGCLCRSCAWLWPAAMQARPATDAHPEQGTRRAAGHGSDNNNCAEFCPTTHTFVVNGAAHTLNFSVAGEDYGCMAQVPLAMCVASPARTALQCAN
jgi:hypothetical protein